ncbi:putative acetyltransferase [Nocardioides luteus]|uniref:N-acetyltransferase n=1 Tax=Nocardioides luteus TaxID=1844 RepID=A0ABQ5T1J9_9ACTN|nr:GNAT family N-acetyltransferase [Nocardioides luteus]MDR7310520.1 putative acetyltransferase [Nocardioides luteus]GGR42277.1 N-acetyltransferase [Nocardioides luteus]GLJ69698.1 N-acetyltransferase [Nocardioides luteus]
MTLRFELDDLTRPEVVRLLEEHLEDMYAVTPAESVHALDLEALRVPEIAFWSAWEETELVGCGALKRLDGGDFELKSMRTTAAARGRGVATRLLRHLLDEARSRGGRRVLLETGTEDFYAPARRLYAGNGFTERPPFGSYVLDPNSVFFELSL